MAWSTAGRNARADATAALIAEVSLHTGDPGAAGTDNEWSGDGYTRQAPAYDPADAGVAELDGPIPFDGPALTNAAWFGLWAAGPVFLGAVERASGDAASNAAGEYSVVTLSINADATITA
jgi:hypothetical protein